MGSIVGPGLHHPGERHKSNRGHSHHPRHMDYLVESEEAVVVSMKVKWAANNGHHMIGYYYYPLDTGLTSSGRDTAYSDCSHLLLEFALFL